MAFTAKILSEGLPSGGSRAPQDLPLATPLCKVLLVAYYFT